MVEVGPEVFVELSPGQEAVTEMMQFWEVYGADAWAKDGNAVLGAPDLGLNKGDLIGTEETLKTLLS